MKFRIFGTLMVLIILGGLYILKSQDEIHAQPVSTDTQPSDPDANALKGLKIN